MAKITPQNQKKPASSNILLVFICLLFLQFFLMKTFFPQKQTAQQENATVQQLLTEVVTQEPVATEPTFKPEAPQSTPEVPATPEVPVTPEPEVPATPETPTTSDTTPVIAEGEAPAEKDDLGAEMAQKAQDAAPELAVETQFVTLGSVSGDSPYRMLVTLTNRGAAVCAVEMNEKRLGGMSDDPKYKGGYVGLVNVESSAQSPYKLAEENYGCPVNVVGRGTPAEAAGLQPGDVIRAVNGQTVLAPILFYEMVGRYRPGSELELTVDRAGAQHVLQVRAGREPVRVIRPENGDPASFLTTLSHLDGHDLPAPTTEMQGQIGDTDDVLLHRFLNAELNGLALRTANWEVESATPERAVFLMKVPHFGLEVRKIYTLATLAEGDGDTDGYHLDLTFEVRNVGTLNRTVGIQQDGPTGLLTEGNWYCQKASRSWSACGIRDIIVGYADDDEPEFATCQSVNKGKWGNYVKCETSPVRYIGVDAQYFAAILIPRAVTPSATLQAPQTREVATLRVGVYDENYPNMTNTSCRLRSDTVTLGPNTAASQSFTLFVGPKRPELLAVYGLDNVVYYGWFSFIAVILVKLLHCFYAIVGNYGVAIILLTILVRVLMFPLSRKQVQGALVMQKLQPEIKKLQEKFKDPMERQRAQMELFKKHKYNPMAGCWVMFIQLPIFIALYRALLVDVELRQSSLFTETFRFCSNLAAPDMFLYWGDWVWQSISRGYGFFGLGPYLNLLPILTIVVFIVQQKVFMPPALDDQARMQQKIMKYMMIFMGFMFFKVPSGLCLYFIMSSLWGLAERRFMPKADSEREPVPAVIDATFQPPKTKPKRESFWARAQRYVEEVNQREDQRQRDKERQNRGGKGKNKRKR